MQRLWEEPMRRAAVQTYASQGTGGQVVTVGLQG